MQKSLACLHAHQEQPLKVAVPSSLHSGACKPCMLANYTTQHTAGGNVCTTTEMPLQVPTPPLQHSEASGSHHNALLFNV